LSLEHTSLGHQLCNRHFEFDKTNAELALKIFNVKDFVGEACSAFSSKVSGQVATLNFENFHKLSARHILTAIFGIKDVKFHDCLSFPYNNLSVTNVNIQIVEPVDEKTKQSIPL